MMRLAFVTVIAVVGRYVMYYLTMCVSGDSGGPRAGQERLPVTINVGYMRMVVGEVISISSCIVTLLYEIRKCKVPEVIGGGLFGCFCVTY